MTKSWLARLLLVGWVLLVSQITLTPVDPLASRVPVIARPISQISGVPEPRVIEFLIALEWPANLLLFLPLGFLLPLAWKVTCLRLVDVGLAISVAIELTQLWFLVGRDASGLDVLANTMGAWIGYWLAGKLHPPQ